MHRLLGGGEERRVDAEIVGISTPHNSAINDTSALFGMVMVHMHKLTFSRFLDKLSAEENGKRIDVNRSMSTGKR